MAIFKANIPNAILPETIDGLCDEGGYDPAEDGPKPAFANKTILKFIKRAYVKKKNSNATLAVEAQVKQAIVDAEADAETIIEEP